MSTATAVSREAAWLQVTDDALPALLAPGGPWQVVQGYWPGAHEATQKTGIYLDARVTTDTRASNQRIRPQYEFTLTLIWPIRQNSVKLAEGEQQKLADATDLLLQRIRGPVGDKTHGGAFLSVAENPRRVDVQKEDPAVTIPSEKTLRSTVRYSADDIEITG